jgi:hypothetical protein
MRIKLGSGLGKVDTLYLYFPSHPGPRKSGVAVKQVRLNELVKGYAGPDLILDLDASGKPIGLEVLA